MKKVIMLGGGGFAREVLDTIDVINTQTENSISPVGFVYDGAGKDAGKLIHGIPVLGDLSYLKSVDFNEVSLVAAIGRPVWRRKMVEEAKKMGGKFMSIIHPTATLSKWARIGEGAIMQRFCIVMPDAVIGDFFISNGFVGIGHDAVIGDYVHMNPHVVISGGTVIGNDVFIGLRATVLTSRIGDGAVIGACALVTKDVPPNMMAKGMPAKFYEMDEKKY
jgi:sugar O-acyltransferase (sialic acid O-acetyltransferase NeuD family)